MLVDLLNAGRGYFDGLIEGDYPGGVTTWIKEVARLGKVPLPDNCLILNVRRGQGDQEHEHILDVICLTRDGLGGNANDGDTVQLMDWVISKVKQGVLLDNVFYLTGKWAYGFVTLDNGSQGDSRLFAGVVHLVVKGTA